MAVSLSVNFTKAPAEGQVHYSTAAKIAVKLLKKLELQRIPRHTLLNLNVPDLPLKEVKGIEAARQGFRYYSGNILRRKDHRGRDYFWVGGQYKGFHNKPETDCVAVESGYASLTPLRLDCTDDGYLEALKEQFNR